MKAFATILATLVVLAMGANAAIVESTAAAVKPVQQSPTPPTSLASARQRPSSRLSSGTKPHSTSTPATGLVAGRSALATAQLDTSSAPATLAAAADSAAALVSGCIAAGKAPEDASKRLAVASEEVWQSRGPDSSIFAV
ncbi:hypothetical protein C8Q73DRAFT_676171 [Cubamyces lactineus]|nr:hypothetical protein C8Q73DRAFT_676171 [Cubamyces lactineus]